MFLVVYMYFCLWRTLLQGYLRILALSVSAFLAILLITRFKSIARFAALSGDWKLTALFSAYQFPLILPIAIPLSALIASFLLFQRLSRTSELIAFRACGLSFPRLLSPLLFASALLSIANFSICAEIAPFCRRASVQMLYRETSANPLLLLQRQQLVKIKDAYLDMHVTEPGVSAEDVVLIAYNENNKRLSLLHAKKLFVQDDDLCGQDVALLSHLEGQPDAFDPLIIENQAFMTTGAPLLSQFMKKNRSHTHPDSLSLKMLRLRSALEEKKEARRAFVEILRRASLSLAVFSFTFLGSAFAIENSRLSSRKNFYYLLGLTLLLLMSYLTGKELRPLPSLAALALLAPHALIWGCCILRLQRISGGAAT